MGEWGGGANATQRETKGDATRTNSRKSRDLFICSKVNGASRLKGCIIYLTCMRAFGKAHAVEAGRGRKSCKYTKRAPLVCNVSPTQKRATFVQHDSGLWPIPNF